MKYDELIERLEAADCAGSVYPMMCKAAQALRDQQARIERLEHICNKAAGAIITKKYSTALAQVIAGVPEDTENSNEIR